MFGMPAARPLASALAAALLLLSPSRRATILAPVLGLISHDFAHVQTPQEARNAHSAVSQMHAIGHSVCQ